MIGSIVRYQSLRSNVRSVLSMVNRKRKATVIAISSSSASSGGDDDDVGIEDDHSDDEDYKLVEDDEDNSSTNSSDDECELSDGDYADDEEDDCSVDSDVDFGDDRGEDRGDDVCDRVIQLLRERKTLQELTLKECKMYLRQHGLRISGTKDVCMRRIQDHWRLKDGNGESLYPRSSFTINCTGDVCRRDVVLFTQKVYDKFDKMTRAGKLFGRRTIAGRVVKESYGAAKQQHTFTVEVLWSRGAKRLPPLFPLLVKGRNLYKMKTFRQPWRNEVERSKVLAEKHSRGTLARQAKARRKETKTAINDSKRQKVSRRITRRSQEMNHCERSNSKRDVGKEGASSSSFSTSRHHQKPRMMKEPAVTSLRPQHHFSQDKGSMPQMVHQFQVAHHRPQFPLHNRGTFASYAPVRLPQELLHSRPMMVPSAEYYGFNQRPSYFRPQMDPAMCIFSCPRTHGLRPQRGFHTCNGP